MKFMTLIPLRFKRRPASPVGVKDRIYIVDRDGTRPKQNSGRPSAGSPPT